MTGCGSFSDVSCSSPQLGTAISAPAPHVQSYGPLVPHASNLAMTGADIVTILFWGCLLVTVGVLAMVSGHKAKGKTPK
jgi:hypothetical protein